MLKDLIEITGQSFQGMRFTYEQAEAALYVVNKIFPKNRKFIGGSVAINGYGKDIDIFIRGGEEEIVKAKELGFSPSNERYPIEDFYSLRYKGINLIFLTSNKEYQRVSMAMHVCCHLTDYVDMEKDVRVAVHEAIRQFGKPIKKKKEKLIKRDVPRVEEVIQNRVDRLVIPPVPQGVRWDGIRDEPVVQGGIPLVPAPRWNPEFIVRDEIFNE